MRLSDGCRRAICRPILDWLNPLATQRLVAHYTKRLHSLGFKVALAKGNLM